MPGLGTLYHYTHSLSAVLSITGTEKAFTCFNRLSSVPPRHVHTDTYTHTHTQDECILMMLVNEQCTLYYPHVQKKCNLFLLNKRSTFKVDGCLSSATNRYFKKFWLVRKNIFTASFTVALRAYQSVEQPRIECVNFIRGQLVGSSDPA